MTFIVSLEFVHKFQKCKCLLTGKTKNIKFTDNVDIFSLKLDSIENKIKYLKAVIESELALGPSSRAYQFASRYPFKIGTSKVLVGVVASTKTTAFSLSVSIISCVTYCAEIYC
jgi:hypothetical protein